MSLKKILLKYSLFSSCVNPKNNPSSSSQSRIQNIPSSDSTIISSRRVSISDISNCTSVSFASDLSNSLIGSNLQIFTHKELQKITQGFSKNNFLGEGGFGQVFKGFIDDQFRHGLKPQSVAVKSLDLDGKQGHREWLAEVIFLGQLKNAHLVNLIGYCCEDEHRLLVYEYMARGNLENHLFKDYTATLPWLTRLKIAVGAAKGLAFLHEEQKPVIYRDLKASNILLDSDFTAKLSDFGLAIDGPQGDETHVTTRVMGTRGYAAPEYIMTGHVTSMSDVYSFGVVLLELISGRRCLDKSLPNREQSLVDWSKPFFKDISHKVDRLVDPRLEGQYSSEGAKKASILAHQCLSPHPKSRPNMTTVVKTLQSLLTLTDIPVPFVYIVPNDDGEFERKEKELTESRRSKRRGYNGHYNNHIKRRSKSNSVVYSDSVLYKDNGLLYSPRSAPKMINQIGLN